VKNKAIGAARQPCNLLNSNGGKPSGPANKFGLSFLIAESTSDSVKTTKSKTSVQLTVESDGMTPLSITPTLAKNGYSTIVIAVSETTMLLLLSINGPMGA